MLQSCFVLFHLYYLLRLTGPPVPGILMIQYHSECVRPYRLATKHSAIHTLPATLWEIRWFHPNYFLFSGQNWRCSTAGKSPTISRPEVFFPPLLSVQLS